MIRSNSIFYTSDWRSFDTVLQTTWYEWWTKKSSSKEVTQLNPSLVNILCIGALPYDLKRFDALLRLTEDTDHNVWRCLCARLPKACL